MKQSLEEKVQAAITSPSLLLPGEKCLVAVSGGIDSMVLLYLLHQLSEKNAWSLTIAHFNHLLRGRESDDDEAFVREQSRTLGLPFVSSSGDVKGLASNEGISVEMAARRLRYEFLNREAGAAGITKIALAHHQDDQFENFFLKFFRGTVGKGIYGMSPVVASGPNLQFVLIRPLLEVWKSELHQWAELNNIPFREDSTNRENDARRNKLRNDIIPSLCDQFPGLRQTVRRWQSVTADEKDFIIEQAKEWIKASHKKVFDHLHPGLQREIIHQQLINRVPFPSFDLIEKLRLEKCRWFSAGLSVFAQRLDNGEISTTDSRDSAFNLDSVTLAPALEAGVALFHNRSISYRLVPSAEFQKSPGAEFLDADQVGSKIILRHWQPGDRMQPIGMPAEVKLQDLFTNAKIPAEERRNLLLAEAENGKIFWVERLRISEIFKVLPTSEMLLQWKLGPQSEQVDQAITKE